MIEANSRMWTFLKGSFGRYIWLWLAIVLLGLAILMAPSPFAKAQEGSHLSNTANDLVYLLTIDDEMISPITMEYIRQGIIKADTDGAEALVIALDTPGGLLSSTHTIVKDILNAPLPVMVYVSPAGGRAGSAGVFITMAAHVAAMAPSTRIGAAHPVDSNGNWPTPALEPEKGQKTKAPSDVMSQKILNDTVAGIRGIAKARGRNEAWAVKAVTESASLTDEEAVRLQVVDFVAPDLPSLLQTCNGRAVTVQDREVVLAFEAPRIVPVTFSATQQFLSILAHPFLAYVLLMVGFYGLLFEVTHPGVQVAGVIGGISLLLALMGMQAMSVNMAGLWLILLGLGLFIGEVFTPTFGGLFIGGLISLVLGTLLLYQTGEPYLMAMVPYVAAFSLGLGLLTGLLLWKVLKTHRTRPKGPYDKLIGEIGQVIEAIEPHHPGKIRVYGEVWNAEAEESLAEQAMIQVVAVNPADNKFLKVVPFDIER